MLPTTYPAPAPPLAPPPAPPFRPVLLLPLPLQAPVVTPEGLKAISGTWYWGEPTPSKPVWSKISLHHLTVAPASLADGRNYPFTFALDGFDSEEQPKQVRDAVGRLQCINSGNFTLNVDFYRCI